VGYLLAERKIPSLAGKALQTTFTCLLLYQGGFLLCGPPGDNPGTYRSRSGQTLGRCSAEIK